MQLLLFPYTFYSAFIYQVKCVKIQHGDDLFAKNGSEIVSDCKKFGRCLLI